MSLDFILTLLHRLICPQSPSHPYSYVYLESGLSPCYVRYQLLVDSTCSWNPFRWNGGTSPPSHSFPVNNILCITIKVLINLHLLEITRHQQKILSLPRFQHNKGFPIVTKIMFFHLHVGCQKTLNCLRIKRELTNVWYT